MVVIALCFLCVKRSGCGGIGTDSGERERKVYKETRGETRRGIKEEVEKNENDRGGKRNRVRRRQREKRHEKKKA